jgi:chemotaxis protein methyltransferase CheR
VTEPRSQGGSTSGTGESVRSLTEREFRRFRDLIEAETGIHLSDAKKPLLVGRFSRRLRALGLPTFSAYLDRVSSDGPELTEMIDLVCTNETSFFREGWQFDFLTDTLLPRWHALAAARRRPRRIRAWSAACSSGEEAYSLGMVLLDSCPPDRGWHVEILATDVSTRMLARAQLAVYTETRTRAVPPRFVERFLSAADCPAGSVRVTPEVRALVRFARVNLNTAWDAVPGAFDIVLCRNTLIYFSPETQRRLIDRLVDQLLPDGHLLVGHAESLGGLTDRLRRVAPSIYERNDGAGGARFAS